MNIPRHLRDMADLNTVALLCGPPFFRFCNFRWSWYQEDRIRTRDRGRRRPSDTRGRCLFVYLVLLLRSPRFHSLSCHVMSCHVSHLAADFDIPFRLVVAAVFAFRSPLQRQERTGSTKEKDLRFWPVWSGRSSLLCV